MLEFLTLFCDCDQVHMLLSTNLYAYVKHVSQIFIDLLLFVMLVVSFILGFFSKRTHRSRSLLWLHIASAIYNGVLGLIYFLLGVGIVIEKHGGDKEMLPLYEWLPKLFQGITWVLLSVSVTLELRKHPPTILLKLCSIWGFFLALYLCIAALWEAVSQQTVSVMMVLDFLFLPGSVLLLFCTFGGSQWTEISPDGALYAPLKGEETCQIDSNEEESDQDNVTPYAKASLLSRMTFWWLNPLVIKGKKKVLDDDDVPKLPSADCAEACYFRFVEEQNNWKQKSSCQQPSILRTLVSCHLKSIFLSGFFALIKAITISVGPLFLTAFIYVAEGKTVFKYEVYALTAGLFVVNCIESLAARHWFFQSRLLGLKIRSSLCAAIYSKQQRLSSSSKITHTPGDIVNYVTVDAYRIGEFPYSFHQVWVTILRLCLALLIVYYSMGLAIFATIIVMILLVPGNSPLAKYQHKYQANFMKAQNRRLQTITEALANMKVLKLYAWESYFRNVIEKLRSEEYKWLKALQLQKGYYVVIFWSTPILLGASTLVVGYFLGISMNASNVFTFLATIRIIQEPIRNLPDFLGVFIEAKVSLDRIARFLEAPELQNLPEQQVRNETEVNHSVFIDSSILSWESEALNPTLKNIYLAVKPGEKVAICGEVGAGKSTLLAAILGELPRLDGTIHVFGTIAYVPQTAWIQTGTIRENILFGCDMDEYKFKQVLEKCSLVKDLDMFPYGDLTLIGERGVNLSGGQKQRVQLARALYQDKDIYLLDDPFSALDAHTAKSLFADYVMEALSGKAVLLVTHQVDFLPAFDTVLLLSEGRVIHHSTYDQLLASSREFQDLVNAHKDTVSPEASSEHSSINDNIARAGEINKVDIEEHSDSTYLGDQLIKKEERETGDVGLKPYRDYLSHKKGLLYFSLSMLAHFIFMVIQILQYLWLAVEIQDYSSNKLTVVLVFTGIGIGSIFFLLMRSFLAAYLGIEASKSIFSVLMMSLFRAPMAFYDSTPVGRILSRVSSDLSIVDLDLAFKLTFGVGGTMTLILYLVVLSAITWQFLLVIIPMIYPVVLLQIYYSATAKELMRINGTKNSSLASHLAESIAGATTIRAFKAEKRFFAENLNLVDAYASSNFHTFTANEWLSQRLEILSAIMLANLALFTTLVHQGYEGSGYVGMALSTGLSMNELFIFAINNLCMLANFIVAVERLNQYMHITSEAPEVMEENRSSPDWPNIGKVDIYDLQIRYRPNAPLVLRGITCTFQGGHKVGIVGRTGSGKTTLISALFRLVEPTGGKIVIDGIDITTIGLHDLRLNLGIIPQDPTLFSGSVRYNLDPLSQYTDRQIWEVLDKCQLRDVIQEKQEGLNSLVLQDGENWSMGQRQLFGLGRVLIKKSRVLVLDEATASIDNATDAVLQKIIRTEFASSTVITVAHRIPTVMDCTMVLSMSDGKLVEYDEPMKLLQRDDSLFGKLVKEYWSHSGN